MALETRHSIVKMRKQAILLKRALNTIILGLRATKREQEVIFARGGTAAEVKTAVSDRLTDLADNLEGIRVSIGVFRALNATVSWAKIIQVGSPKEFHHFSIDVDNNGATKAAITFKTIQNDAYAQGGVPPFSTGDLVEISNSSNSAQNGIYTVNSDTAGDGTDIILTGILPGSDNTDERSMKITLYSEMA